MKAKFDSTMSDINKDTDIETYIPPHKGWNYVGIINHPVVKGSIMRAYIYGKWLLFIPERDFVSVFRLVAKLTITFHLTSCFKASGEGNERVFCIYCPKNIDFIKQIAEMLNNVGLINKYGFTYTDGTKAIFFKSDDTTHFRSKTKGMSLSLFKYTYDGSLFVKKFINDKPSWERVTTNSPDIVNNFEDHLDILEDIELKKEQYNNI